eukprot:scaffold2770_cov104-Cylindrotheca_fusiformis.AAC.6
MTSWLHYSSTFHSIAVIVFLLNGCYGFLLFNHKHRISKSIPTTASSTTSRLHLTPPRAKTIPVLGPIPGCPPILVGEDFMLEYPSPLQWSTLEECLHNHELYLQEKQYDVVGIEAAPLVAVMDDITSRRTLGRGNKKYATIAAIVGIQTSSDIKLDTSSEAGFMESVQLIAADHKKTIIPSESKIRLVGIGRAALSGFHSRLPNSYWQSFDSKAEGGDDEGLDDGDYHHDDERETPLLIAQFQLMVDTGQRSDLAQRNGRARFASPVHALAEMSQWAAKLQFMHEDRQRLVRGLRAADARLKASTASDLEDHDGIGLLSSGYSFDEQGRQQAQPVIERLLEEFPGNHVEAGQTALDRVMKWDNYGLGSTAAAFSSIPPLTKILMEKLQAYYSPQKQATEEHYFETMSFMAVLSLKETLSTEAVEYALKVTNTVERMRWAYERMIEHKLILQEASEEISADLRDCGEECTDLW